MQAAVNEARSTALEQISALWQLQVDRVREQLESGWRDQLDAVFQDRFAEVTELLERRYQESVEALGHSNREKLHREHERLLQEQQVVIEQNRAAARAELAGQLNQVARGLRQAESREVWIRTLLEATADFCGRAALFAVAGRKTLRFEGGLGVDDGDAQSGPEFALADAPAIVNALESKDTVVTMASPRELSEAIFHFLHLAEGPPRKAYLLPLVLQGETVGVLYAEPGDSNMIDIAGLELLTGFAVHSMEAEVAGQPVRTGGLVSISGVSATPKAPSLAVLPKEDQQVHLKAQRFARTRVAEMLLFKVAQVKKGRADRNIYGNLKAELDAAREAYREQFLAEGSPSMVDYLHLEIVTSLCGNDPALLGPGYPGPLV
jgi:hypothetical protein